MKKIFLNQVSKEWKYLFMSILFSLTFLPDVKAADREIGGYVDRAEDRFVRNVWNFIKTFRAGKLWAPTAGRKCNIIGPSRLNLIQIIWILLTKWILVMWLPTAVLTLYKQTKVPIPV